MVVQSMRLGGGTIGGLASIAIIICVALDHMRRPGPFLRV